jgi:hypothetical protein
MAGGVAQGVSPEFKPVPQKTVTPLKMVKIILVPLFNI